MKLNNSACPSLEETGSLGGCREGGRSSFHAKNRKRYCFCLLRTEYLLVNHHSNILHVFPPERGAPLGMPKVGFRSVL